MRRNNTLREHCVEVMAIAALALAMALAMRTEGQAPPRFHSHAIAQMPADLDDADAAPRIQPVAFVHNEDRAGVNKLPASVAWKIDAIVQANAADCRYLNLGIVDDGKIVYTKSYGEGQLKGIYEYGSVSKPITSTIIMQLRRDGLIMSLDDNVWDYLPRYRNAMPSEFKGARLTLKHLLTHTSGIPHNEEDPIVNGLFNLKFRPGTGMRYSTPGYGFLGSVIESVTGQPYARAVAKYIGKPVGAASFCAGDSFISPGAFVYSTIDDMARFAIGVMDNRYMSAKVLFEEVLRPEVGSAYACGWSVRNLGGEDVTAFHSGSNGLPRAHVLVMPKQRKAVVILAQLKTFVPLDLDALSRLILEAATS